MTYSVLNFSLRLPKLLQDPLSIPLETHTLKLIWWLRSGPRYCANGPAGCPHGEKTKKALAETEGCGCCHRRQCELAVRTCHRRPTLRPTRMWRKSSKGRNLLAFCFLGDRLNRLWESEFLIYWFCVCFVSLCLLGLLVYVGFLGRLRFDVLGCFRSLLNGTGPISCTGRRRGSMHSSIPTSSTVTPVLGPGSLGFPFFIISLPDVKLMRGFRRREWYYACSICREQFGCGSRGFVLPCFV